MIREATLDDVAQMARVHVDSSRHAYAGILPPRHLAALDYDRRAHKWREHFARPHHTFVAEAEGRIIGFANGGPNRVLTLPFEGELNAIYLLPEHQRRGVGRALVAAMAGALAAAGHASMIVWVLRDNPACRFYERLGGTPAGAQDKVIGGATLAELAYGWPSLAALRVALVTPA